MAAITMFKEKFPIILKNLGGGESVIIGENHNSIIYIRGESKLYYSKDLLTKTIERFNGKGPVQSRDLKAFDRRYIDKPCHCTFFVMLMEYLFGEKVKIKKKTPFSIEFDVKQI